VCVLTACDKLDKSIDVKKNVNGDIMYVDLEGENITDSQFKEMVAKIPIEAYEVHLYSFSFSEVTDLSPLTSLPHLWRLSLIGCSSINDLSALASLSQLRELSLRNCSEINDLSALASLPEFKTLCLTNQKIGDVSALASLSSLDLKLNSPFMTDLSTFSSLSGLKWLVLSGDFSNFNFSSLASLKYLETLTIHGRDVPQQKIPLAQLTRLKKLELDNVIYNLESNTVTTYGNIYR
jgi:hypothetical protein